MSDPVSTLFARLRDALGACVDAPLPGLRLLRAAEQQPYEWTLLLDSADFDLGCLRENGGKMVGEATFQRPFLGFRVGEEFLWEMLGRNRESFRVAVEGSLRAAETAAALKSARQVLKQVRKRLAGLEKRKADFPAVVKGPISPEMHGLVAAEWQLWRLLEAQEGKWQVNPLARALEQYGRAMTRCWEREQVDVPESPVQTARNLHVWSLQQARIDELLEAITP